MSRTTSTVIIFRPTLSWMSKRWRSNSPSSRHRCSFWCHRASLVLVRQLITKQITQTTSVALWVATLPPSSVLLVIIDNHLIGSQSVLRCRWTSTNNLPPRYLPPRYLPPLPHPPPPLATPHHNATPPTPPYPGPSTSPNPSSTTPICPNNPWTSPTTSPSPYQPPKASSRASSPARRKSSSSWPYMIVRLFNMVMARVVKAKRWGKKTGKRKRWWWSRRDDDGCVRDDYVVSKLDCPRKGRD